MAKTILTVLNQVLIETNQAANSTAFSFFTGTGTNAITTTGQDVTLQFINDAKDHICRTCFLYSIVGTLALTSPTTNLYDLSGFTFTGKTFNFLQFLKWTPVSGSPIFLPEVSWQAAIDSNPALLVSPSTAVPSFWYDQPDNNPGIYLNSIPSTNGTLTGAGYGLPVDFTSINDSFTWLPDNYWRLLVLGAIAMVVRKRIDDPLLVAKYEEACREYDTMRLNLRSQISPDLAEMVLGPFVTVLPPPQGGAPAPGGNNESDGE